MILTMTTLDFPFIRNNCMLEQMEKREKLNSFRFLFSSPRVISFTVQFLFVVIFVTFLNKLYFLKNTSIYNIRRRYRDSPHTASPDVHIASPIINIPHKSRTFVATDELMLIYHYHSKFIVYSSLLLHILWVWIKL